MRVTLDVTVLQQIFSQILADNPSLSPLLFYVLNQITAEQRGFYAKSTLYQLYFFSALYALLGLASLVPLFIRWRDKASLAPFKALQTSRGKLIYPQTAVTLNALSSFFCFIAQGCIWKIILVNFHRQSPYDEVVWRTLVWIPLWFIVIETAWGMTIAHLKTVINERFLFLSAWWINTFFMSVSLSFFSTIVTLFVLCNKHINDIVKEFDNIYNYLAILISRYDGKASLTDLLPLIPIFQSLLRNAETGYRYWRVGWAIFAVALAFALIIYLIMFWSYINVLRYQLQVLDLNITLAGTFEQTAAKICEEVAQRAKRKSVYVGLIVSCILTLVSTSVLLSLTLWVSVDSGRILGDPRRAQIADLTSFWSYSIIGSIGTGLAISRAFAMRNKSSPSSSGLSTSISWSKAYTSQIVPLPPEDIRLEEGMMNIDELSSTSNSQHYMYSNSELNSESRIRIKI